MHTAKSYKKIKSIPPVWDADKNAPMFIHIRFNKSLHLAIVGRYKIKVMKILFLATWPPTQNFWRIWLWNMLVDLILHGMMKLNVLCHIFITSQGCAPAWHWVPNNCRQPHFWRYNKLYHECLCRLVSVRNQLCHFILYTCRLHKHK